MILLPAISQSFLWLYLSLCIRFCGQGILKFKDGRKYEGNFFDGLFHGEGTLFVHGGSFVGFWERGNLVEGNYLHQKYFKSNYVH